MFQKYLYQHHHILLLLIHFQLCLKHFHIPILSNLEIKLNENFRSHEHDNQLKDYIEGHLKEVLTQKFEDPQGQSLYLANVLYQIRDFLSSYRNPHNNWSRGKGENPSSDNSTY